MHLKWPAPQVSDASKVPVRIPKHERKMYFWKIWIDLMKLPLNRPNQVRFVLPISSHVIMLMGSFGIMLPFALMANLCMA